jgi:hypothetical protein
MAEAEALEAKLLDNVAGVTRHVKGCSGVLAGVAYENRTAARVVLQERRQVVHLRRGRGEEMERQTCL